MATFDSKTTASIEMQVPASENHVFDNIIREGYRRRVAREMLATIVGNDTKYQTSNASLQGEAVRLAISYAERLVVELEERNWKD